MSLASLYLAARPPSGDLRDAIEASESISVSSAPSECSSGNAHCFGGRPSTHSVRVKFGILQSAVCKSEKNKNASDDPRLNLTRLIFGSWHHRATAGGVAGTAQALVTFHTASGEIDCFDFQVQKQNTIARMKAIGLYSHLQSQQRALSDWLGRVQNQHAIAT